MIESPLCTYTIRLGTPYACGSPVIDTCKYRATQLGLNWDLTSLKSNQDYQYKSPASGTVYTIAFCGGSKQTGTPCGRNGNSACVYDPSGAFLLGLGGTEVTPPGNLSHYDSTHWLNEYDCDIIIGQWSLINEQHPSTGIEQTFANGDYCIDGAGQRVPAKLNIRVYCNPSYAVTNTHTIPTTRTIIILLLLCCDGYSGSMTPFGVTVDDNTCTYTYTFAVPQGCPF